jgi:hypothetical protein
MTFHPAGRASSASFFHKEPWLDFDMYQSGHMDYAQDTMLFAMIDCTRGFDHKPAPVAA